MFEEVASGDGAFDFMLLTDRSRLPGWPVFWATINGIAHKFEDLHLFTFEKLPNEHQRNFPPQFTGQVHYHDYASDPLGWNCEKNIVPSNFWISEQIQNLGSKDTLIVIDSLIPFLKYCGLQQFSFNLETIRDVFAKSRKKFSIFSLLHRDLCDGTMAKRVSYLSNCVLNLVSLEEIGRFSKSSTGNENLCEIIRKKKGGKITESIESFIITKQGVVVSKSWQPQDQIKDLDVGDSPDSPLEEEELVRSTFKLNLSEREKEARNKLVMPYTKPSHLRAVASEGMIYYEPDDADDFDDEDPDDDLDF